MTEDTPNRIPLTSPSLAAFKANENWGYYLEPPYDKILENTGIPLGFCVIQRPPYIRVPGGNGLLQNSLLKIGDIFIISSVYMFDKKIRKVTYSSVFPEFGPWRKQTYKIIIDWATTYPNITIYCNNTPTYNTDIFRCNNGKKNIMDIERMYSFLQIYNQTKLDKLLELSSEQIAELMINKKKLGYVVSNSAWKLDVCERPIIASTLDGSSYEMYNWATIESPHDFKRILTTNYPKTFLNIEEFTLYPNLNKSCQETVNAITKSKQKSGDKFNFNDFKDILIRRALSNPYKDITVLIYWKKPA